MFKHSKITAAILTIALSACASTPRNYVPVTTQISYPELSTRTTVSIGSDMLRQGTATVTKGIFLSRENNVNNYLLSKGFYPQIGEDKKWTYHAFQVGTGLNGLGGVTLTGGIFGQTMYPQSILASKSEQKTCVKDGFIGQNVCDTENGFERVTRPVISENNFQQTLIYSGRVGDRVKIGYRESSGDMARPAFSNEAEYDLSVSNEIAYRGAKIRIIEANNQSITYEVLSNFNVQ